MRLPFVGRRRGALPEPPAAGADSWSTMIVPAGTELRAGEEGRLSIRTPGNLVLQCSGRYHTLESVAGSIRIEPQAEVEAVEVICRDTLYVQGSLVAWRVAARALQLEQGARAHVVLQEAEQLEVGRSARLVGNFGTDRELLGLFARFARELRSMPLPLVPREEPFGDAPAVAEAVEATLVEAAPEGAAPAGAASAAAAQSRAPSASALTGVGDAAATPLADPLFFALLLLERAADAADPRAKRAIAGLVRLLREGDVDALRQTHRRLFAKAGDGADVARAAELVAGYFGDATAA